MGILSSVGAYLMAHDSVKKNGFAKTFLGITVIDAMLSNSKHVPPCVQLKENVAENPSLNEIDNAFLRIQYLFESLNESGQLLSSDLQELKEKHKSTSLKKSLNQFTIVADDFANNYAKEVHYICTLLKTSKKEDKTYAIEKLDNFNSCLECIRVASEEIVTISKDLSSYSIKLKHTADTLDLVHKEYLALK